ncbi:hypothetical protein [Clostridium scatologenes]|uniref:Uncharacterized protein n=1 Tax=Clostridium scatologenes TaxID=1548 RepID=A0A0E3K1B3_CLOSL|nr:hypothetical protein [Clostridium scatologenes]AKA69814.1 hypothetical protein CSCA_2689 [Clostridium scatologenes]
MKSKKIIASLMALSIIGSSSLVLGGTAKAATLNSTSTYTREVSDFSLDVHITSTGVLVWNTRTDIPSYRYKVMKIEPHYLQDAGEGGCNDYRFSTPNISGASRHGQGIYFATVRAIDKDGNILKRETYYFYYDGSKFSGIGSDSEPIHY